MARRSTFIAGALVVVAAGGAAAWRLRQPRDAEGPPTVAVARGSLVDKALAVGTIEPRTEVGVKSVLAGVVRRQFAQVGDFVQAGQPLLEITPSSTPVELLELRRAIDLRRLERDNAAQEHARQQALRARELNTPADFEAVTRRLAEAEAQLRLAQDRLALQETGRIAGTDQRPETVVRAPISGYVLEKSVEIGDPVVPLTSFQEGTVLLRMAAMKDLVFRGTVDEIDVGRLREGMPVDLRIGALPEATVRGRLDRIWLKGRKQDQATVFPVEVTLTEVRGAALRAGYSANAEVVVARRDDVLVIPERMLTHRNDSAFVTVRTGPGRDVERHVRTGLSDAITIEVLSGLRLGEQLVEPPAREI